MMKYKLKNVNGRVTFLLKTGKDFVRNQMAISSAQHIIDNGTLSESTKEGYPICVDEKWYFEGEPAGIREPKGKAVRHETEI